MKISLAAHTVVRSKGKNARQADTTELFAVCCGGILQTMAQLLQKYLQVQGIVGPPAITSGISIAANVAANWAGAALLGLAGVAIAATATRVLLLLSIIVAVVVVESSTSSKVPEELMPQAGTWETACKSVKAAFTWKIIWTFLALGIPGASYQIALHLSLS